MLELYTSGYSEEIMLPPDEYAMVMRAFNTDMSEEDRRHRVVAKAIGDYVYYIINHEYDDYVIIGKYPIDREMD